MAQSPKEDDPSFHNEDGGDEDDLWDRIRNQGIEVAYQIWDSGGPGAGMGRVSVYEYQGKFFSDGDTGIDGPFASKGEAVDQWEVFTVNSATKRIWDSERGTIFVRRLA